MADSVEQLFQRLERGEEKIVEWGEDNHVEFNNTKDEAIPFIRKRKLKLKRRIAKARINVLGYTMEFNLEITMWLGVYLDTRLKFWAHKNFTLEKVRKAEGRLQHLAATRELVPGLVRLIQVAVIQVVTLYKAEVWWNGQKG